MGDMDVSLINIEKAKAFWKNANVDHVFDMLLQYLMNLRDVIKTKTASDKEYVQGMHILQNCGMNDETLNMKHYSIEEVVIGEEILTNTDLGCLQLTLQEKQLSARADKDEQNTSPEDIEELTVDYQTPVILNHKDPLTPLSPHQDLFDLVLLSSAPHHLENDLDNLYPSESMTGPHDCSAACIAVLPPHPDHFLGQNPLRAPLLCHFRRQCLSQTQFSSTDDAPTTHSTDGGEEGVLYKAPCGRLLPSFEEVLQYLQETQAFGVLQPWNFSFNPLVRPEQPPLTTSLSKRDLSRGIESVAVQLCNDVDSSQPAEFRYRRERWPHGCFLSAGELFSACCDCTDGCTDSLKCTCLQLSQKAADGPVKYYTHQRLQQPVGTGLYECSPWCGCDPHQCQNRVVQHGVRVRLQVFRKNEGGWGVRCRDDLDTGTFICTYAGVVLRTEQNTEESPARKCLRDEPVSDDEVEVVEEWTHPVLPPAGSSAVATDTCPPSHIPVIQRPTDHTGLGTDNGDEEAVKRVDQETLLAVGKVAPEVDEDKMETDEKPEPEEKKAARLRASRQDNVQKFSCAKQSYYLDATKEGNIGRFINHSSSPNLFVQNVFVDTHDPQFPMVAFFTSRTVKAGTELTWNHSPDVNGN